MSELISLDGVEFRFAAIPPGQFLMGSERGGAMGHVDQLPVHPVTIQKPFLAAIHPVSQRQWALISESRSWDFRGFELPAHGISWDEATAYCAAFSDRVSRTARLPTEAEWEYMCRAGSASEYFFSDTEKELDKYAWYDMNSMDVVHEVAKKAPNPWGLFDMVGNVWEWCADVWHDDYSGAPDDGSSWDSNPTASPRRALRGGACDMDSFRCRSAYRSQDWKDFCMSKAGVRMVIED